MNIKQTVMRFIVGTALALSLIVVAAPATVLAQECGGVQTAIISCDQTGEGGVENTGLWGVLILAINILTGLVAVAALGGIVYGSILYTSAGGNAEQTKKAMGIITNVVIGIIAYGLMYVGLNFLVPGGVFN